MMVDFDKAVALLEAQANLDVFAKAFKGNNDSKAAATACDVKGCSVLHYAISSGKPATQLVPMLDALLQQGADVNAADDQGISALHQAAKSSPCAVLEALLTQDAAVNLQDKVEGKTPLHFAAERGVQAAVRLLLDKGASAVIADTQGRLPFQLASGKSHSLLSKEAERQGGSALKHRPASPSLSNKSRLSSSLIPKAVPFANVTNTPASRAPAAAAPASQDDSHAVFGGKGAASRDASRRRSQGLENLQEQLQGVMMEGNQIQEYVEGAKAAWTEGKSMLKAHASLGNKREQLRELHQMQERGVEEHGRELLQAGMAEEPGPDDRDQLQKELAGLRAEADKIPGLQEQLSRSQAALEQWKAEQLRRTQEEAQIMARDSRQLQTSQRQLVLDYDKKLAAATEAERAIGRAMTTQVESLRRQVASLTAMQAENEALKAAAEAKQQEWCQQQQSLKSIEQALNQFQVQENKLQRSVSELQALQHTTAQRAEQLSKKGMQLTADKAAVESALSLKEEESDSLWEENGALRRQCLQHESQAAALQDEAAEHVRTITAGNAQVKLLQSKAKYLEEQARDLGKQAKPAVQKPLRASGHNAHFDFDATHMHKEIIPHPDP
ncbi:hypothetical protein WJX79_010620 [Trebouxia sp. C0005]